MAFDYLNWIIIPIIIFLARIADVSLGTIRVITINKGLRIIAPIIGFFEVIIWIVAMRQIMNNMDNPVWFIAYAAGFAAGTYIGIVISDKLSLGNVILRIVTRSKATKLVDELEEKGFGTTVIQTEKKQSKGQIIFSIMNSKYLPEAIKIIQNNNPKAFFTIEEVKKISNGGIFPKRNKHYSKNPFTILGHKVKNNFQRKGK